MIDFSVHSSYSGIHLLNETNGPLPIAEKNIRKIVTLIQDNEQCSFKWIEIVFVDEQQIIEINKEYLGRKYVTDIISFRYDTEIKCNDAIEGTLYGCARQINRQARQLDEAAEKEFYRIIVHGLLHLCGYEDKSTTDKQKMTKKENFYLDKLL